MTLWRSCERGSRTWPGVLWAMDMLAMVSAAATSSTVNKSVMCVPRITRVEAWS